MTAEDIRGILFHLTDIVQWYIDTQKLPDCNECSNRGCGYMPRAGQRTRINCPLFKPWKKGE